MTELQEIHSGLIKELLDEINNLMVVKAKEYQRNNNPFHNFQEGTKLSNSSPLDVLRGFKLKHDISINDLCEDYNNGDLIRKEMLSEKIKDIIIYNLLMYSLILNNVK